MGTVKVIAEIGINHFGDTAKAKRMIALAKHAGADIAKTQLYDPEKLFPDHHLYAQGRDWYEKIRQTELSRRQSFELAEFCDKVDIEFMASCFDLERLSWLEEIGVKRHKIAYNQRNNQELINAMWDTNKPLISSIDAFSDSYLPFLVGKSWQNKGNPDVTYLYCIPEYPTPYNKVFFGGTMFLDYNGFSDHTIGYHASLIAVAQGATVIEKHFKIDEEGPDVICSLDPVDFTDMVKHIRKMEEVLYDANT